MTGMTLRECGRCGFRTESHEHFNHHIVKGGKCHRDYLAGRMVRLKEELRDTAFELALIEELKHE